jgi:ApeA N-terminal domain 1/Apea-like HEPN
MRNEKNLDGVWWLPFEPATQSDGLLTCSSTKSPRLKLKYRSVGQSAPPDETEAFQGVDEGGTPITVLRAGWSGGTRPQFLSEKTYIAGHILRGIHVDSLTGFRANRVDFWLQNLGAWLGEEGFDRADYGDSGWRINYRRPDDRCYPISSGTSLKVCHSSHGSATSRTRSIRYDIFFSVEKTRPFDFFRAFKWLDALRNLLHFACLQPIHATAVKFEDFKHTFEVGDIQYPKQLELFTAGIHDPLEKDPHFVDFVFTFNDVESRFTELCGRWFRFCTKYRESLGCYTTTVYFDLPPEIRLICLTQALEAFHQRRFKPKSESDQAKFVNRIKDLCMKQSSRISPIVGDIERFAVSVRDSRHYYTHHDPEIRRKGNVLSGTPLMMMTYRLQFLFRLCVLSEFGLDTDPHSVLRRQMPSRITEFF